MWDEEHSATHIVYSTQLAHNSVYAYMNLLHLIHISQINNPITTDQISKGKLPYYLFHVVSMCKYQ